MDHLASVAEMAHTEENEQEEMVGVENKYKSHSSSSLKNTRKRNSDNDMYLSAEEKIDVNILISSHDSFVFPRDDQQNYICVFQGCTKPILRGLNTEEYLSHLRSHASNSDRLLSNMLRRVPNEQGDKKAKRRRANSTNSYSTSSNIVAKKQKDSFDGAFEKEDSNGSPDGGSPRSPDYKRTNSTDEYNIPLKPSSRGVQLRDQMLRYGLHLFRIDSEGKYICFFDECSLHMMTNFSRHIAKHEKNGDKIKQELLHLCSPSIVQQQLHQHPNSSLQSLSPPPSHSSLSLSSSSSNPQIPLQQLLLRHQQETIQLQQQQQHQQQMNIQSAAQLEQLQNFHSMQFHQLQMQHNQQLQMFHQNLSSVSPVSVSPAHQQISQQTPSHFVQQQQQQQQQHHEANKRPKSNVPELSLLSQVRDESDLALMRTQISKMLEDSSRNHPNFSALSSLSSSPSSSPSPQQKRSLSLAYYNSPSMQESPSLRHPYHPSPSMNIPSPARSLHSHVLFSPRMQNEHNNNNNNFNQPHPQENSQRQRQRQRSLSPSSPSPSSSSPSSPSSSPSSEIKWIFPKNKPVPTK